ncbi:MAG: carbon storage regulator, CsrA [Clostridia bacterium]|jgi:carbon storage regulator|nr:carbon storage regulator, CsrA [Clostridia bacterium]
MLVLARKKEQSILIGDDIEIVIVDIGDDKVKIGINAPKTMKVFRKELLQEVEQENKSSVATEKLDVSKLTITLGKK